MRRQIQLRHRLSSPPNICWYMNHIHICIYIFYLQIFLLRYLQKLVPTHSWWAIDWAQRLKSMIIILFGRWTFLYWCFLKYSNKRISTPTSKSERVLCCVKMEKDCNLNKHILKLWEIYFEIRTNKFCNLKRENWNLCKYILKLTAWPISAPFSGLYIVQGHFRNWLPGH